MKKLLLLLAAGMITLTTTTAQTQRTRDLDEINENNSWFKLGLNLGAPTGDLSTYSKLAFGVEASAQFMRTDNFGMGITSGYTKYYDNDNISLDGSSEGFGAIPLGLMLRYYPQPTGFFVGSDIGYTFFTDFNVNDGGFYVRPQMGYHNYDWNIFGFYNQVFRADPSIDVSSIGVAVTYNLRFR
jgi:outer membrane protein W